MAARVALAVGVVVPAMVAVTLVAWLTTPVDRPNILLVTVDSLRADHLGAYGYGRPTSPNLDALARRGVTFGRAFTQATLTGPSHATIMTSVHTPAHGAINNAVRLREDNLTLAEILRAAGYETAMFVSDPFVSDEFGFSQGFHHAEVHRVHPHDHDHGGEEPRERMPRDTVFRRARWWLRQPRQKPFFLWIHCQHPHKSYEPPEPYDRMFGAPPARSTRDLRCMHTLSDHQEGKIELDPEEKDYVVDLYDGEVAYVDAQIGRLLAALESLGLDRSTVVLLTADHGEMLFDDVDGRVVGHGRHRFDPVLRVPLILGGWSGAGAGRRIESMVSLIDVAPTLLAIAGVRPPQRFQGKSLLPLIEGRRQSGRRTNYSCTFHTDGTVRLSARTDRHKLICDRRRSIVDCQLYDLQGDPGEREDRLRDPAYEPAGRELGAELDAWFRQTVARGRLLEVEPPDRRGRELLVGAGYLEEAEDGG